MRRQRRFLLPIAFVLIMVVSSAVPASAGEPGVAPAALIPGWHMRKAASSLCLVARSGPGERTVEQSGCAEFTDQGWSFEYPFGGATPLQIRNIDRNLCIVTRGSGESRAVVSTCNAGFRDQLWDWTWDSTWNGYHFVNLNSNLCLVARGTSPAVQSVCGNYSDQVWQLY